MNDTDKVSAEGEAPSLPPEYRLKPSRNQKQRSKLKQVADEDSSDRSDKADVSDPTPPTPAPPPPAPSSKKIRLKRSGHMHDSVTAPLPEGDAAEKESEY